jgi:hypothetical protein
MAIETYRKKDLSQVRQSAESLVYKTERGKRGRSLFVYLSVCLSVRVSARCDWLTGDYLRKGSKTPGATTDLARRLEQKTA